MCNKLFQVNETCLQTRMKKEPVKVERIIKDKAEISLYVKLNNRS